MKKLLSLCCLFTLVCSCATFLSGCAGTGLNFDYDSTGQNVASIGNAEYQGSNVADLKVGGRKFKFTLFKWEIFTRENNRSVQN